MDNRVSEPISEEIGHLEGDCFVTLAPYRRAEGEFERLLSSRRKLFVLPEKDGGGHKLLRATHGGVGYELRFLV